MNERTSKPIPVKMHVKKGDRVKVISGGDKGTVSEVTDVFRKTGLIKARKGGPVARPSHSVKHRSRT